MQLESLRHSTSPWQLEAMVVSLPFKQIGAIHPLDCSTFADWYASLHGAASRVQFGTASGLHAEMALTAGACAAARVALPEGLAHEGLASDGARVLQSTLHERTSVSGGHWPPG